MVLLNMNEQEKADKIKKTLDVFKDKALEQFEDYIQGIGLLPPNKEENKENINVLLLMDDSDSKKLTKEQLKEKLTNVISDIAKKVDKKIAPQIILSSEFVQDCYDNKGDIASAIASSAIIYDKGLLSGIKVSEVHKSMVLERFEKYIVSYVIGGSLVTDKAKPDSDIDAFVIIDDTDVKKMTRAELKDKLRSIISGMSADAKQQTGIERDFHVQVYILTDFWDNIKDANPVIFTFVRDGIPLYDRGVFMPWKNLLNMGRIKPSPEAIDMLMNTGEQMLQRIDGKLKEIGLEDFFWATITSSQAAIMLYGLPPPTPNETSGLLRDLFVKKEKIFEEKHVKTLEKVLKIRKDIERGKKTKIQGKEIDELRQETQDYLDAMKKLFEDIELKKGKEDIKQSDQDLTRMLQQTAETHSVEFKEGKEEQAVKELVKKNQIPSNIEKQYREFKKAKQDYNKGTITKKEIDKATSTSRSIIRTLVENLQRKKSIEVEQAKIRIKKGNLTGELILLEEGAVLTKDINNPREAYYIKKGKQKYLKPKPVDEEEAEKTINEGNISSLSLNDSLIKILRDIYGEGIEISMS